MNMFRFFIVWLYVVVWQVLRVFSGVILLFLVVIYVASVADSIKRSSTSSYVPPGPIVCGKMAGVVYEFQRVYFPFWPEYEGKSSFDPDFINNKRGCDANLRSVFMAMTWPGLEPAKDRLIFEQGLEHEGLLVAISPIFAKEGDLRLMRDYLLSKVVREAGSKVIYDDLLKLYLVEGGDRTRKGGRKRIYWSEASGEVTSLTECLWRPREPNFYACQMTFVVFGVLHVEVTMLPEKLVQWPKIQRALEVFITKSKK
ncbi:hypothetical protein [Pseudomonas sp. NBRC 111123]|uniref:hypothetical protein n=1 Tax=Pseudomonas sp. NBRC 111123 TaxID=1661038 RepID=UPI0015A58630|nr:hypothetical protein [Pseudomonas sp. NBRC 111123]